jgi:hypothetical protein
VRIVPLLLWSVWAARRGSLRGLLLWTAALFYLAYSYSYAYYVLSPESNVLCLAYIAIAAMSLYGCLYLLISTTRRRWLPASRRGRPYAWRASS